VLEHRAALAADLGLAPHPTWCWLDQVHGATVVDGEEAARAPTPPRADAAVTAARGVPLVVMTADCLSIALASDHAVAVVHAGWKGLLAGVVEEAVVRLREAGPSRDGGVLAAIGPCARPGTYEFGRADLDRLVAGLGPTVAAQTVDGRPALDLPEAARRALDRVGVADVWDCGIDTIDSPEHFSYRREGRTGRQALVAWIPA